MLEKTKEVFTKEYRDDIRIQMFLEKNKNRMKLKGCTENMDTKIARLENIRDIPVFRVKL